MLASQIPNNAKNSSRDNLVSENGGIDEKNNRVVPKAGPSNYRKTAGAREELGDLQTGRTFQKCLELLL
jgi:hypothetical protein